MEILKEKITEIEENLLNLILFYDEITKFEKIKLINSIIPNYFTGINREIVLIIKKLLKEKNQFNTLDFLNLIKNKPSFVVQIGIIKNSIPTIIKVNEYIEVLHNRYITQLITESKTIQDFENIEKIKKQINLNKSNIKKIGYGAELWEEKYNKSKENEIVTLYDDLDKLIGSFAGGDYIALGGGTGQGKTMFALNLAINVLYQNKKVLYCSLEMPLEQLQNRIVCIFSGINAQAIRKHNLTKEEIELYKQTLKGLKELDLEVVTDYKLTIDKLEEYIAKSMPNFVIIDYLGLMMSNKENSLYEKITSLSRQIKVIATTYNVPILVLVQLNRDLKSRDDKTPKLSDIRESGAIEQDSDFVIFTHREYVYDNKANKNLLKVSVAKNRHGEANKSINLRVNLESQKVSNYGL